MEKKISMKEVFISPTTYVAWEELCKRTVIAAKAAKIPFRPEDIMDEEFYLVNDELVIRAFVGPLKMELTVPKGQWTRHN